jgi:hypothetical protein
MATRDAMNVKVLFYFENQRNCKTRLTNDQWLIRSFCHFCFLFHRCWLNINSGADVRSFQHERIRQLRSTPVMTCIYGGLRFSVSVFISTIFLLETSGQDVVWVGRQICGEIICHFFRTSLAVIPSFLLLQSIHFLVAKDKNTLNLIFWNMSGVWTRRKKVQSVSGMSSVVTGSWEKPVDFQLLNLRRRSSCKQHLRIQSVPQTEHHSSPLHRSTG